MKKHIKKKYLFERQASPEEMQVINANNLTIPFEEARKFKKVDNSKSAFLFYDSDAVVLAFPYTYQGFVRWIPEPDPVLMYFNSAYYDFKAIKEAKKKLLNKLVQPKQEDVINDLYALFSYGTGAIINLFTTLEAFINRAISSNGFTYTKKIEGKRTEIYTKTEIERNIGFDEKMNEVLKQVYEGKKKPFIEAKRPTYDRIKSLKQFRDELIHLKSVSEDGSAYEFIHKKLLDYKYEDALNAVKDFCNYYHVNHNYIEECPCSNPE